MRRLAALLACLALAAPGLAADPKKPEGAPRSPMKACTEEAEGMKGEARKDFMARCLRGKGGPPGGLTQQELARDCAERGAGMKGETRDAFMKACLRGEE